MSSGEPHPTRSPPSGGLTSTNLLPLLLPFARKRKRSGFSRQHHHRSPSVDPVSPAHPLPATTSIPPISTNTDEEILVVSKDPTAEALNALSCGFPADSLTEEELDSPFLHAIKPGSIDQINYTLLRNHLLSLWRTRPLLPLPDPPFPILPSLDPRHHSLLLSAFRFLLSHGHINFGVPPHFPTPPLPTPIPSRSAIVIGAGLAGLAAARQLLSFGFHVLVLEARKRPGGRVYTKTMSGSSRSASAELGGSVLTGTLGNPLCVLARQLSIPFHKIRDKCPLYCPNGKPVDPDLDEKVETEFNCLLDNVSRLRQSMGDITSDISLGAALETFRATTLVDEELSLFNWHLANLEYANAGLLSKLSLAFWDQDDPFDMGGDHCFLPGGNGRLVQALAEGLPIVYEKIVHTVRYGQDGVQILAGSQVYQGDVVLCTVPLGVLKSRAIKFVPELPQRKLDGIRRLGFGLLNKVAMLFPHVFWSTDLDTFGHLSNDPGRRGEFFLFYSYASVAGGPLLIALVAGEAAHAFETMPPTDAVTSVLRILRDIYEPQGIIVPDPIQSVCTRWGTDNFSLGSYSHVAVGASGDDYDILAESVGDGKLFFAGEATSRRYPATMHGAFLSGLREAANIANRVNAQSSQTKIERSPTKKVQSCAALLEDLFREPDVEFGSFAVIFGPETQEPSAILRVTFGGSGKKSSSEGAKSVQQHSNKPLFQQLQSHYSQLQQFHVYTLLPRKQALDLREVRGGDEMRLHYLCEALGVKLIGRRGLGPSADSLIASIKTERANNTKKSAPVSIKHGRVSRPSQ